jgi:hypothetical protein
MVIKYKLIVEKELVNIKHWRKVSFFKSYQNYMCRLIPNNSYWV